MVKVLITGGCGFIGSNFIKYLLTDREVDQDISITNLDKLTYAGQGKNLEHIGLTAHQNYHFVKGNIVNSELVSHIFKEYHPNIVFNFAAESHVDKSIQTARPFYDSNIIGALNIFEAAKEYQTSKVIQISTDEVYGSRVNGSFSEKDKLNPASPYSSSKASSDLIALSYFQTHSLPVMITRSANNYGPYQFPEKFLPLFITNLIDKKQVPLMWSDKNPGLNVRDWLHVKDNCRAIWYVYQNGENGEIYNIPGEREKTNIEMTKMLLNYFNVRDEQIQKIPHRKGHDFRYSIKGDKLKKLGFQYKYQDLETKLKEVIKWYENNEDWWRELKR